MAEAILAMPDYNNFVRMMVEAAQQLEAGAVAAAAAHSSSAAEDWRAREPEVERSSAAQQTPEELEGGVE